MTRDLIEGLMGRDLTDAEWNDACELLNFIERHPGADAVVEQCIDQGLSAEQTIQKLSKLPPVALDS
jgi:hypothetical protein